MKKEIFTEIEINASADKVWSILTDFSKYPEWNPLVRSINGDVKLGNAISFIVKNGQKDMKVKGIVTSYKTNCSLSWMGKILPGFKGEHFFIIHPNKNKSVIFIHKELYEGFLVSLVQKKLDTATRESFIEMNIALKKRAEG